MDLLNMLKQLIKCIDGDYFLSDGGLLGIIRQRSLLEHDDDLDIYLLPGSTINFDKLKEYNLDSHKWYSDTKIYSTLNPINKKNRWIEYCSFIKTHNLHLNRAEVFKLAKETYRDKFIEPKFTTPYIDIYYINEDLTIDLWPQTYFFQNEIETTETNCLGFPVKIPIGYKNILSRNYGYDWKITKKDFHYF
tara:strand:- start:839 stop:1411 length:573 start_codon:yes stop_codon:yes gene_type:complete